MFKPHEYVDQLLKYNGAGLRPEDRLVFEKLKTTNEQMDAAEAKLQKLTEEIAAVNQQRQTLHARGAVLVELLFETYTQRIVAKE